MKTKRHCYADLIHQWAEGAEIEVKHDGKWTDLPPDIPPYATTREYRIKPQETPWYDSIPPQGVLCWVSDITEKPHSRFERITHKGSSFQTNHGTCWKYATPLTDDEIRQFLRGE
jgi:hypothetical protein